MKKYLNKQLIYCTQNELDQFKWIYRDVLKELRFRTKYADHPAKVQ